MLPYATLPNLPTLLYPTLPYATYPSLSYSKPFLTLPYSTHATLPYSMLPNPPTLPALRYPTISYPFSLPYPTSIPTLILCYPTLPGYPTLPSPILSIPYPIPTHIPTLHIPTHYEMNYFFNNIIQIIIKFHFNTAYVAMWAEMVMGQNYHGPKRSRAKMFMGPMTRNWPSRLGRGVTCRDGF